MFNVYHRTLRHNDAIHMAPLCFVQSLWVGFISLYHKIAQNAQIFLGND